MSSSPFHVFTESVNFTNATLFIIPYSGYTCYNKTMTQIFAVCLVVQEQHKTSHKTLKQSLNKYLKDDLKELKYTMQYTCLLYTSPSPRDDY